MIYHCNHHQSHCHCSWKVDRGAGNFLSVGQIVLLISYTTIQALLWSKVSGLFLVLLAMRKESVTRLSLFCYQFLCDCLRDGVGAHSVLIFWHESGPHRLKIFEVHFLEPIEASTNSRCTCTGRMSLHIHWKNDSLRHCYRGLIGSLLLSLFSRKWSLQRFCCPNRQHLNHMHVC